jgi:hypothetical protein
MFIKSLFLIVNCTGVQRGMFHISLDFITNIFRSSTRGSTPYNNFILDGIYEMIGSVCEFINILNFVELIYDVDCPTLLAAWRG